MLETVDTLIALAQKIKQADTLDEIALSEFERYAMMFSEWYAWFEGQRSSGPEAALPVEEEKLRELATLHAQVLAMIEGGRQDTIEALRALRKRGRGIMAYADTRPRRISISKKKRG